MLKLKKNVKEFIKANVKPECFDKVVKYIETEATRDLKYYWTIAEEESVFNKQVDFRLMVNDFEEVEELKPNVWYTKEDFDGNPKNYWIIERYKYGGLVLTSDPMYLDSLEDQTTHFMLVEPFDEAKDDAS